MCAIIGASSTAPIDFKDIKMLYLMAEDRGGHACGFTNGRQNIKSAVKSFEYVRKVMNNEKFPKVIRHFVGHTRYATIGNKGKDENAHPFTFGNIIGVHNGSIYNHKDIKTVVGSDEEVDSAILYEAISKFGLKKTLPLVQGLVALSYYDKRNNSIYLYRNELRPLSYGYKYKKNKRGDKVEQTIFWASLPAYLEAINCVNIKSVNPHTLYRVKNGRIMEAKQLKADFKTTKPKVVKVKGQEQYSHTPSLNIFSDKRNILEMLNDSLVKESIEEYDEQLKKKDGTITRDIKVTVRRAVPTEINNVPMHAKLMKSSDLGLIAYWWDSEEAHVVNIFSYNVGWTERYNLLLEEDMSQLNRTWATDSSDILQDILHAYNDMVDNYELRMEAEANGKEACRVG
jgi:glucosamine 6-phosphate synthetase-like amidotransferase/phosphosugar isomerase protein